jgi:ABC-type cobalamin/Fe3+-siderophores transport system ATPase subunit
VEETMMATEVGDFADRPFAALSGRERSRVAPARVLAQRAPLLLLDEPTAALDVRHQELVFTDGPLSRVHRHPVEVFPHPGREFDS